MCGQRNPLTANAIHQPDGRVVQVQHRGYAQGAEPEAERAQSMDPADEAIGAGAGAYGVRYRLGWRRTMDISLTARFFRVGDASIAVAPACYTGV